MGVEKTVLVFMEVFFIMIGVPLSTLAFISQMADVTTKTIKPSYQRLSIIDSAHSAEACIIKDTTESLSQKLDACRKTLDAAYIELTDAETGEKFSSGSRIGDLEYSLYTTIRSGKENHQAILYVKKEWKSS